MLEHGESRLLERGEVRDGVFITLFYTVDDLNNVTCSVLNEAQLEAFTAYVHESQKHKPKHGNSLRMSTHEEIELWDKFCETLLICATCGSSDVLFNPYSEQWLCTEHGTGLEE